MRLSLRFLVLLLMLALSLQAEAMAAWSYCAQLHPGHTATQDFAAGSDIGHGSSQVPRHGLKQASTHPLMHGAMPGAATSVATQAHHAQHPLHFCPACCPACAPPMSAASAATTRVRLNVSSVVYTRQPVRFKNHIPLVPDRPPALPA